MDDCNEGCKEIERIETLVIEAKKETYSMCEEFRNIITSKIYCPTVKKEGIDTPEQPVPTNKFDRIMLELHKIINTIREFKKIELSELEKELSKL